MKTPYEILGVEPDADDEQIKSAYIALVKRFPPERDPSEFQKIYKGYKLIKTAEDRLRYTLFHCSRPTVAELVEVLLDKSKANSKTTNPENIEVRLQESLESFCKSFLL